MPVPISPQPAGWPAKPTLKPAESFSLYVAATVPDTHGAGKPVPEVDRPGIRRVTELPGSYELVTAVVTNIFRVGTIGVLLGYVVTRLIGSARELQVVTG